MARSSNTFRIHYNHMDWREDALCIFFSQMKNDQFGERPRDPRHVYANPFMPEICPILSLGMYWLSVGFDHQSSKLYPGASQYYRFCKIFEKINELEEIGALLEAQGIQPEDLGSHSLRKGSATYCSSGSTCDPSASAIHLRAGWTMGGVTDTYIRYEAAGDCYVGRTVCGLPLNSADFATIGPHFANDSDGEQALARIFPDAPNSLKKIAIQAIASLIYHHGFPAEHVHETHPIRSSMLFRDASLIEEFKPLVRISSPSGDRVATGIPPHVILLCQTRSLLEEIKGIPAALQDVSTKTVNGIVQELDQRAIGARTLTANGLNDILRSTIVTILDENNLLSTTRQAPTATAPSTITPNLHSWGGGFKLLSQDYDLPKTSVSHAWQLWLFPDSVKGYPALKNCSARDFASESAKKRFCDLKLVMGDIKRVALETNLWSNELTVEVAMRIYHEWENVAGIHSETPTGRDRRSNQLKWSSVARMLRQRPQN